jgi:hypothetical protein
MTRTMNELASCADAIPLIEEEPFSTHFSAIPTRSILRAISVVGSGLRQAPLRREKIGTRASKQSGLCRPE